MLRHTPKLNIKKANYRHVLSTEIFFNLRESFRPSARFAHKDTKTNLHQRFDDTYLISPHTMADTLLKGVASHKS